MRDLPSGRDLSALATALGETGALAERCHAIARREAADGDVFAASRAALRARYGAGQDETLLARLAGDIRAGALDEGSAARAVLAELLLAITRAKLAESNPLYLDPLKPL